MTKQQLIEKHNNLEWKDIELEVAKGELPK